MSSKNAYHAREVMKDSAELLLVFAARLGCAGSGSVSAGGLKFVAITERAICQYVNKLGIALTREPFS